MQFVHPRDAKTIALGLMSEQLYCLYLHYMNKINALVKIAAAAKDWQNGDFLRFTAKIAAPGMKNPRKNRYTAKKFREITAI